MIRLNCERAEQKMLMGFVIIAVIVFVAAGGGRLPTHFPEHLC